MIPDGYVLRLLAGQCHWLSIALAGHVILEHMPAASQSGTHQTPMMIFVKFLDDVHPFLRGREREERGG